jgi:serine protease Do
MNHSLSTKTLSIVVGISLIGGFAGGLVSTQLLNQQATLIGENGNTVVQPVEMKLVDEKSAVVDAIEQVSPSVVSIVISQELSTLRQQGNSPFELFFPNDPFFNDFFGQQQQPPQVVPDTNNENPVFQKVGGGSGFFIDDEGLIMTNRHVVSGDDVEYTVILHDGSEYKAEVVSRDFFNDIAVIKLVADDGAELPQIKPVRLGTSADLKIGQSVIAIGNALAEFSNSATRGIISAKGRQIVASNGQGRGENLSGLIQTDAAINPGNSGGPLINMVGEVIGVNTAIAANANGIGFAIPIDDVKTVIKSVQENGRIVRPILGVLFTMLTPEIAADLGLEVEEGALLKGDEQNFAVLPGKPAEKAGLLEKDVIIKVNGKDINIDHSLQQEIMNYAPGDVIDVTFIRKGEEKTLKVTLEEAKFDE